MMPWGHIGVAYFVYAVYSRGRYGRPPMAVPALLLAFGSQFPDLVDKPLAWGLGVLPGGRTLAHSLITTAVLLAVLYAVAAKYDRTEYVTAFAIGHVSHLVADIPPAAPLGDVSSASFLLWPLLPQGPYDPVLSNQLLAFVYQWFQIFIFVVALFAWYRNGMPGLNLVLLPYRNGTDDS